MFGFVETGSIVRVGPRIFVSVARPEDGDFVVWQRK